MSKLTPEARALFDEASQGDGPTHGDHARVRAKLALRLGAGAAVGTAVGTTVGTGSAVAGAKVGVFGGIAAKLLAVVVVTGGIGGAGYLATRHDAPARLASAALVARSESVSEALARERASAEERAAIDDAPAAGRTAPEPEVGSAAPANASADHPRVADASPPAPRAPASAAPAPVASTAAPSTAAVAAVSPPSATLGNGGPAVAVAPAKDSLVDETALLGEAQAALRQGRGEAALRTLDDHSERFKSGALRDEGRATRILVLCQLGRVGEARAEAARFLRESPRSPMAARVRGSCAAR